MTPTGPVVPQTVAEADPRRWIALFTLLMASFMNLMDVTIVNVALPSMQADLGASSSQLEWIVAGYILFFALGLLPFGRLGDILGRKQLFLGGVGAFTLASTACGMAPSIEWLIIARVLQGVDAPGDEGTGEQGAGDLAQQHAGPPVGLGRAAYGSPSSQAATVERRPTRPVAGECVACDPRAPVSLSRTTLTDVRFGAHTRK